MQVVAFLFQPFESRADLVIGLKSQYNPALVDLLRETLKPLHKRVKDPAKHISNAGGWLNAHRVWFVERVAWAVVHDALMNAGYDLRYDSSWEHDTETESGKNPCIDCAIMRDEAGQERALHSNLHLVGALDGHHPEFDTEWYIYHCKMCGDLWLSEDRFVWRLHTQEF